MEGRVKVVCYYDDPDRGDFPRELFDRWSDSFYAHGFDPVFVTEKNAKNHHNYEAFKQLINSFPHITDTRFEEQSWLRWLAYESLAPALFADYDVINYNFRARQLPKCAAVTHLGAHVIYATPEAISKWIAWLPNAPLHAIKVNGRKHLADWIAWNEFLGKNHVKWVRMNVCREYGRQGYTSADMVHFSNGWLPKHYQFNNRWKLMDEYAEKRR